MKKGAESIWLIGDKSLNNIRGNIIQMRHHIFLPLNFETRISTEDQHRGNATGRIINSLNTTFNNNGVTIPKWVVIIPENDIIRSIEYTEFGVSGTYGMIIEHIMKEMDNAITSFLGPKLLHKVNRFDHPHILWLEPSLHVCYADNSLRT